MKRKFDLPIVAAVSTAMLSVASCGPNTSNNSGWTAEQNTKVCADGQNGRVLDFNCASGGGGAGGARWIYVGRGGYIPPVGSTLTNGWTGPTGVGANLSGSNFASAGESFSHASSISRGGFGGFGGHGGGGE
jgi:hypothetical protein